MHVSDHAILLNPHACEVRGDARPSACARGHWLKVWCTHNDWLAMCCVNRTDKVQLCCTTLKWHPYGKCSQAKSPAYIKDLGNQCRCGLCRLTCCQKRNCQYERSRLWRWKKLTP